MKCNINKAIALANMSYKGPKKEKAKRGTFHGSYNERDLQCRSVTDDDTAKPPKLIKVPEEVSDISELTYKN